MTDEISLDQIKKKVKIVKPMMCASTREVFNGVVWTKTASMAEMMWSFECWLKLEKKLKTDAQLDIFAQSV